MVTQLTYHAVNDLLHESTRGFGTALAQTTSQTYDAVGNLLTLTDALHHESAFQHDNLRRLRKITNPLSEEILFDYTGTRLTRVETGRKAGQSGRALRRAYDERGRFTSEFLIGSDGSEILSKSMNHDAEGRVLTVTPMPSAKPCKPSPTTSLVAKPAVQRLLSLIAEPKFAYI